MLAQQVYDEPEHVRTARKKRGAGSTPALEIVC
jgi:hypothetical protein